MTSQVLTVEELAAELRIGRNAAYRLVTTERAIFAVRIGRSIRIPRVALERYLAGEDQAPAAPEAERGG